MIAILILFCGLVTIELQPEPELVKLKDSLDEYVLPEDVYHPTINQDDFDYEQFECEYC